MESSWTKPIAEVPKSRNQKGERKALGQNQLQRYPSQGIRKVNGKTQEQKQSSSSSTLPNPQPKQPNKKKQTHTQLPQNPQNSKKKKKGGGAKKL